MGEGSIFRRDSGIRNLQSAPTIIKPLPRVQRYRCVTPLHGSPEGMRYGAWAARSPPFRLAVRPEGNRRGTARESGVSQGVGFLGSGLRRNHGKKGRNDGKKGGNDGGKGWNNGGEAECRGIPRGRGGNSR